MRRKLTILWPFNRLIGQIVIIIEKQERFCRHSKNLMWYESLIDGRFHIVLFSACKWGQALPLPQLLELLVSPIKIASYTPPHPPPQKKKKKKITNIKHPLTSTKSIHKANATRNVCTVKAVEVSVTWYGDSIFFFFLTAWKPDSRISAALNTVKPLVKDDLDVRPSLS